MGKSDFGFDYDDTEERSIIRRTFNVKREKLEREKEREREGNEPESSTNSPWELKQTNFLLAVLVGYRRKRECEKQKDRSHVF